MEYGIITKIHTDDETGLLLVDVEVFDGDEITVELNYGGVELRPKVGDRVFFTDLSGEYSVSGLTTSRRAASSDLDDGEIRVGHDKSDITFRNDGSMELNGGTDYAIAFNEMKKAFDKFVKEFNAHTHPAPAGATSPPSVASMANMDGAKVKKVKL